jgi:hypothetical protein
MLQMHLKVLAQPCRKLSVNINLSCNPLCCELMYIHGCIEYYNSFYWHGGFLCSFIPSCIWSFVGLFLSVSIRFLLITHTCTCIFFNKCFTMDKWVISEPSAKICKGDSVEPSTSADCSRRVSWTVKW